MNITKEQLEKSIYEEHLTYDEIARKFNMGRSTVDWYINKFDIPKPRKNKHYPTKEELYELYYVQRKPTNEIMKIYSMGQKTLTKLFNEYGLEVRPLGTNQGHSWTYEEVKALFKERGLELLETEYRNSVTPMRYRCEKGHEGVIRFICILRGNGCQRCGAQRSYEKRNLSLYAKNRKLSYEEVKKIFEDRGAVLLSKEYKNATTPLEYICPKCGARAFMSLSNFKRGYGCANCKRLQFMGEKNPHYNPNLSDEDRQEIGRYEERYKAFRKAVFARDRRCVICGEERNKVVHHLDGYAENPEKRTDTENAVTLCETCHKKFHSQYGYGGNTKQQFEEFRKACE